MNKNFLYLVILLIPITIISFFFKETIFYEVKNTKHDVDNMVVKVDKNKELIDVDIEEYVIGVVAGEMPASFEKDALKAQAIASRTYAIYHLLSHDSISATIDDQVYLSIEEMKSKWGKDYNKYYSKVKEAVYNTKGLIMYYDNEPIKSYYYSMSNGYTESAINVFNEERDYLKVVESPWDVDNFKVINMSKKEFCNKLSITCNEIKISNIKKDESNRVEKITVNSKTFSGGEIRKLLSLRSTDFEIKVNNQIEITTRGYGHGVGMSQYGANYMAKEGYNYEEILKYYYQNIEINSI